VESDRFAYEIVAAVEDVPDGALLAVKTSDGEEVCLFNFNGDIGAVHNVCTHAEFPLSDGQLRPDGTIECVWHGARFDCRSGAVCRGPAVDDVPTYETLVENGKVLLGPRRP
jgi:3-phenylpropionate/trans-cinnamate dioxygenase ferredoxin subunit